jgi:hypothetical protein
MTRIVLAFLALFAFAPAFADEHESARPALARVAVIGASVSAGRGLKTDLARTLEATLARQGVAFSSHAQRYFFTAPYPNGEKQVEEALSDDPTLVVAVDFLFWFGYGTIGADGAPMKSEDDRLKLLDSGLSLLQQFGCPIVLGDFADMSPAVGRMMLATQMPKPETLARLNARVRDWAAARKSVLLVPLAKFVGDMREQKPVTIGKREFPPAATSRWLQRDRLHTTDEGLVAVALLVEEALLQKRLAAAADFLDDPAAILERVRKPSQPAASTR